MTVAASDWVLASAVLLCGVLCVAGYLLTFALSRRLHESSARPTIGLGELFKPLACGMLLGLAILACHPDAAQASSGSSKLLSALLSVSLAGLCAGGWNARPQLGRTPVSQADLVRRLCVAGNTHEDATARVAVRLALAAGYDGARASDLLAAASLHDIGTCGISASILNKAAPLDAQERCLLQSHTRIGYRMLAHSHEPMLDLAADIALHHHERWDGGGYPGGLSGEHIPLTSRAVALAEAFDRLLGGNCTESSAALELACRSLQEDAGRCFDPRLVALLLADLPAMVAARNGGTDRVETGCSEGTCDPVAAWLRPARFRAIPPQRVAL